MYVCKDCYIINSRGMNIIIVTIDNIIIIRIRIAIIIYAFLFTVLL